MCGTLIAARVCPTLLQAPGMLEKNARYLKQKCPPTPQGRAADASIFVDRSVFIRRTHTTVISARPSSSNSAATSSKSPFDMLQPENLLRQIHRGSPFILRVASGTSFLHVIHSSRKEVGCLHVCVVLHQSAKIEEGLLVKVCFAAASTRSLIHR